MEYTPNHSLTQWEKTDRIRMEDFNANNYKLEQALTAEAEARTKGDNDEANARAAAVKTITAALAGKGTCTLGFFTYTGTGAVGESSPTVISFPRKPLLFLVKGPSVLLFGSSQDTSGGIVPTLVFDNYMYFWSTYLKWSGNNALIYTSDLSKPDKQLNTSGMTYQVFAFYQEG